MRRLFRLPGFWVFWVALAGMYAVQGCADRQPVSSRPEASVVAEPTPSSTTAPAESQTPVQDPSIAENVQRLVSGTLSARRLGDVNIVGISCWSPDGKSVLCLVNTDPDEDQELAFVSLASGKVAKVATDVPIGWGGSLSPDGNWIFFDGHFQDAPGYYIVSSGGGESTRVSHPADINILGHTWSPDSQEVLVSIQEPIEGEAEMTSVSLYTIDLAGRRKSIKSPFDDNTHPRWSRDGKSVGFLSGDFESMYLNRLDVIGGDVVLSSDEIPSDDRIDRFVRVLWSPTTDRVAYLSKWTSEHIGLLWIKVIGVDDPISVTSDYDGAAGLCWSPGGEWLAFVGLVETVGVFVVAKDGTGLKRLLDWPEGAPMYLFDMSWSPDGSRLLLSGMAFDGPGKATYVVEVAESDDE